MTIGRHPNRMWWLGGLVVVLGLLAHDGLMATVAHATPLVQVATMAHGGAAAHQASGLEDRTPDEPAPGHPSECGTAGTAVPTQANEPDGSDVAMSAIFAADNSSASEPMFGDGWSEPSWPPGTRRALLQVYRI
jgi:hypothetical protein